MFKFAGKEVIDGALEKLAQSGPQIGHALKSAWDGFLTLPGFNIPPFFFQLGKEIPGYWENLPTEQKQALFNALVAAGTKAAASYAKKPA